jgi:hypothetical protein
MYVYLQWPIHTAKCSLSLENWFFWWKIHVFYFFIFLRPLPLFLMINAYGNSHNSICFPKTYEWDPYVSAFPWFLSSSWRCYCLFWCNLHNLSFNVSFKTNYIHFIYVHKYVSTINTIARKENFHKITTCTLFINLPYNSIETKFFIK